MNIASRIADLATRNLSVFLLCDRKPTPSIKITDDFG